jgi:polyisoprenoid-binding protein YceI
MTMSLAGFSQPKYLSRAGHIWFYSKTPMETIEAHNNQVACFLDASKGTIAFEVLNKSFKFERALMEEHFNENYMESAKFPKATFKGQITNLKDINFTKDGIYNAIIEGDLSIHGVTKHITQKGTIEVAKGKIIAKAKFGVKPEDYNIIIPALVKEKIANPLDVSIDITFDPMK